MIRNVQNIRCGLIGEHLSHSFSPQIHARLADYKYSLFEISPDRLGEFLLSDSFDAANVTIPYKKAVIPYLDVISDEAKKIGAVNTLVKRDGKLFGDNTDYYGFSYLVSKSGIDLSGKTVLILGTGGASLTARAVCDDMGAARVVSVSRNGDINYSNVYEKYPCADVIINCTPVGMYPENLARPVELSRFKNCSGVLDMIYNPQKTQLLLDAEKLSIPHANGLAMLVAQAKRACEIFLGVNIDDRETDLIIRDIGLQTQNIILIGMPGCGKSTIADILSKISSREAIDTDDIIRERAGISIPEIFAQEGEDGFRKRETEAAADAGKQSGKIIATGGGIVTREENYAPLSQNGLIFFIQRDIEKLPTDGRPLSQKNKLSEMYDVRLPLYRRFCDFEVKNNSTAEDCAKEILRLAGL